MPPSFGKREDNSITAKTTGNSIEFEVTRKGIRAKSLDHPADPTVAFWTTLYEWQAERKMFEEGEHIAHPRE